MAVPFSALDLTGKGLEEEYEKIIDGFLNNKDYVDSRMRVEEDNYTLLLLLDKNLDVGSFLALREKYVEDSDWDDMIMVNAKAIKLVKAITP